MIEDPALTDFVERLSQEVTGGDVAPDGLDDGLPSIVGLHGRAGAGKDTVAAWLVKHRGYTRLAFGDALKECLYALNPIVDAGSGLRLAEAVDIAGWDAVKREMPEVRSLLQRMGTDVGRDMISHDLWISLAVAKMEAGRRYVISDVRFPDEAAMIRYLGEDNLLVDVVRRDAPGAGAHVSETAMETYDFDLALSNNASLNHLLATLASIFPTRGSA